MGNSNIVGDLRGRLIAFDLDGTVIDSRQDLADAANQLIDELGGHRLSEEAIGDMVGEGAALLVRRALAAAGVPQPSDALPRFLDIYDERLLGHTVAYEGIPEALQTACELGRVALLTNKPMRHTTRILDGLGLRRFFEDIVAGDGPYPRKPDPASLEALMRTAAATAQCTLLVGDSAIDHETARRAGARCCVVSYGFGRRTLDAGALSSAEWIVDHARDLPQVFDAFSMNQIRRSER